MLGKKMITKTSARRLLSTFNTTIRGTKDEPHTLRGVWKMSDEGLTDALKKFKVSKGRVKHKVVKSSTYDEPMPKEKTPSVKKSKAKPKKGTKDAPSTTDPGTEDYTGKKGQISKSKGPDVAAENPNEDYVKPKKKRTAKQKAATKRMLAANKKRRAAKK